MKKNSSIQMKKSIMKNNLYEILEDDEMESESFKLEDSENPKESLVIKNLVKKKNHPCSHSE